MFARAALSLRVPRLAAASAPRLAAASAPRLGAAPVRSLLTTTAPRPSTVLAPRVCAPVRALRTSRTALAENPRSNVFVLDSYIVKEWSEIPKGGIHGTNKTNAIWSIWYNHAVTPLYATIALATAVMVWFLYRYFVKHTDIAWSKSMRSTYDHQGLSESRAASHSNRLMYPGVIGLCHTKLTFFPFNWVPFAEIREKHMVPGLERD